MANNKLIKFKKLRGPTIKGKKLLLTLNKNEKAKILNNIAREWRYLIRQQFSYEAGLSGDGYVEKWKPLTPKYLERKEKNGLHLGILEASNPKLYQRYNKSIRTNSSNFSMYIEYPRLISGKSKVPVTAAVHQTYNKIGRPRRRIIIKGLKESVRSEIRKYFNE